MTDCYIKIKILKISLMIDPYIYGILYFVLGKSMITKKSDGSQVKESTDSSTTIEEDEVVKGK